MTHVRVPTHDQTEDHGGPAQINLRTGTEGHRHCLMVGNSLTHFQSMPAMLSRLLSAADDQPWVVSSVTRGGATLDWHRRMGYADDLLNSGLRIDALTIQDQSRRPAHFPAESQADIEHYITLAEQHGAQPIGYLTWDIIDEPTLVPTMQQTFQAAVQDTRARIAWAGTLWDAIRQEQPELKLHVVDGKHPTVVGSLLAALSLCHALVGRLPDRLPAMLAAGGYQELPISRDQAELLRQFAQRHLDGRE